MTPISVDLIDPPAYSPPYDHALAAALARAGAQVRLITSPFSYGEVPAPDGYTTEYAFYRRGQRNRRAARALQHLPDWRAYRRRAAADVFHLQWGDVPAVPRPRVVTVHDPHGIRGLRWADAVIVHTDYARSQLPAGMNVEVIHHGPLPLAPPGRLPLELARTTRPVILCFGLIRPYKGIETLLGAWRQLSGAELWIVGRPLYDLEVPAGVGYVPRYVSPAEQAALFDAADIVVLPYLESERFGFSGVLATAMAAGKATVVSALGGFAEAIGAGAALAVAPGDPAALAGTLQRLIDHPSERASAGAAAQQAAENQFSWDSAAAKTLALYTKIAADDRD